MASVLILKHALALNKKSLPNRRKRFYQTTHTKDRCRICNQHYGSIQIFNYTEIKVPEEIQKFSGVQVMESDDYSNLMCQDCLKLLKSCILFRKICQKTNDILTKESKCTRTARAKKIRITSKPNNVATLLKHVKSEATPYQMSVDIEDTDIISESGILEKLSECISRVDNEEFESNWNDSSSLSSLTFLFDEWPCPICKKIFKDKYEHKMHILECSDSTDTNTNMEQRKKFKRLQELCEFCGKTFTSRASIYSHKLLHKNIFPFECDKCSYKGRTKDKLKIHMRSHLAEHERPYKCTICSKYMTTTSNLSMHMKLSHGAGNKEKKVKCTICDKSFRFKRYMEEHILTVHQHGFVVAECHICQKSMRKKSLKNHLFKVHNIKTPKIKNPNRLPSYILASQHEEDITEYNNESI